MLQTLHLWAHTMHIYGCLSSIGHTHLGEWFHMHSDLTPRAASGDRAAVYRRRAARGGRRRRRIRRRSCRPGRRALRKRGAGDWPVDGTDEGVVRGAGLV